MKYIIIIFTIILGLASCSTNKQFQNNTSNDTIVKVVEYHDTLIKRDSVFYVDSTFVKEFTRNDTVYLTEFKYKIKQIVNTEYKIKEVLDSIYISKVDTVTVIQEIPAKISSFQNFRIWLGNIILILIAAFLMYYFVLRHAN